MQDRPVQTEDQPEPHPHSTGRSRLPIRIVLVLLCGAAGWLLGSMQGNSASPVGGALAGLLIGLALPLLWFKSCST